MSQVKLASKDNISKRKQCDYCSKIISSQHMSRHVKTFHQVKVLVICETCKKQFSNKDLLNVHIKRDHKNQTFDCNKCSRSFKNPSLLTRHKQNNIEEKSKLDRCPNCCQRFISTLEYNKHLAKGCGGTLSPETTMNQASTSMGPPRMVSKRRMTTGGKAPIVTNHIDEDDDDVEVVAQTQEDSPPEPDTSKKARIFEENEDDFLFQTQKDPAIALAVNNEDDEQPSSFEQSQSTNQDHSSHHQITTSLGTSAEETPVEQENDSIMGVARGHLTQFIQDEDTSFEYLLFLFEIWGVTTNEQKLDETVSTFSGDEDSVLNVFTCFLQGKCHTNSATVFKMFLEKKPETLVGNFVRAVMIVDFCLKATMLEVMKLLELCIKDGMDCVQLMGYSAAFILQRSIRTDRHCLDGLLDIPEQVAELVVQDAETNSSMTMYSCGEVQLLMEVRQLLGDAIDLDAANSKKPLLFATEKDFKIIREAWNNIATIITTPKAFGSNTVSWTEMIIERDLDRHVTTVPYFTVVVNNSRKPVHLHEGIVNIFSTNTPRLNQSVWGKQSDVDTLVKLLYQTNSLPTWIPNVTIALFDMAMILEIGDMWKFLYRGHTIENIWHAQENKLVLIRNVIKLKVPDLLKSIRHLFNQLRNDTGYGSLAQLLSCEEIGTLVAEMELEGMDLYYFLLEYCYHACNLNTFDRNHIKRMDQVAIVFNKLYPAFKIEKVSREDLNILLKHRYVPFKDVLAAMSNAH